MGTDTSPWMEWEARVLSQSATHATFIFVYNIINQTEKFKEIYFGHKYSDANGAVLQLVLMLSNLRHIRSFHETRTVTWFLQERDCFLVGYDVPRERLKDNVEMDHLMMPAHRPSFWMLGLFFLFKRICSPLEITGCNAHPWVDFERMWLQIFAKTIAKSHPPFDTELLFLAKVRGTEQQRTMQLGIWRSYWFSNGGLFAKGKMLILVWGSICQSQAYQLLSANQISSVIIIIVNPYWVRDKAVTFPNM